MNQQLDLWGAVPVQRRPPAALQADNPAVIASEIVTELHGAIDAMDTVQSELRGDPPREPPTADWSTELTTMLEQANARAERDLEDLRRIHAKILVCTIADLDDRTAADAAERAVPRRPPPTPPTTTPERTTTAMGSSSTARTTTTSPGTKRLTPRQQELLRACRVVENRAIIVDSDFLSILSILSMDHATPEPFDACVMNPPFSRRADIHHVRHAARFVRPGGRLAAIMSGGIRFRGDKLGVEFRSWLSAQGATIEDNDHGAFSESGTEVSTVMVAFTVRG
jgi:hypothetical protein